MPLPAPSSLPAWLKPFTSFLLWWPRVNRESARVDLMAGLTGALVVLPQGVAFATLAGMPPEYGLSAAMVPVMVRTDSSTLVGMIAALPVSMSTAIVSPMARPRPSMTAAKMPELAAGIVTL